MWTSAISSSGAWAIGLLMPSDIARTSHGQGASRASQSGTAPTTRRTSAASSGETGTRGTMHSPQSVLGSAAAPTPLLPLDRGGGLRGDVVHDAVDAAHLVDDATREAAEEVAGKTGPVGRHAVGRLYGPDPVARPVGAL